MNYLIINNILGYGMFYNVISITFLINSIISPFPRHIIYRKKINCQKTKENAQATDHLIRFETNNSFIIIK